MQPRGGGGDRMAVRKGPWTAEEDEVLQRHVREHGPREWSSIRSKGLLLRTGKSCRLRWVNKLRPNLKTGCKFSAEEERVVIDLQAQFGNKWARIATYLPGRTDNDVKNFWSTRQKRLARILRAPLPRRRSGKHSGGGSCGASSSSAASHKLLHASEPLCQDQDPCFDMIPFQKTMHHHHIGQSSQEPPFAEKQCADAPFPGFLAPEPVLPSPIGFAAMDTATAAECSSSYGAAPAAHHHLSFLCAGDPAPMIDHAAGLVVDAASVGDDDGVAYMEPKPELQQPGQLIFGLEEEEDGYGHVWPARRDTPDVLFDDLPPEMYDFFELPPSPPRLHPPPPSPSTQL